MGATPVDGVAVPVETNQRPSIRERVPARGRCFRFSHFGFFWGSGLIVHRGVEAEKAPTPSVPVAEPGSRSSLGGRRRNRLRLWRGSPRTRSPLPFLHRL